MRKRRPFARAVKTKPRSLVPLEKDIHARIATWLRACLPAPWKWTTFPSGGGGRVRGAHLKQLGLLPGVPDILLFHPDGRWISLEIKRPQGGVLSEDQKIWLAWSRGNSTVVRGIDEAAAFLRRHGIGVPD